MDVKNRSSPVDSTGKKLLPRVQGVCFLNIYLYIFFKLISTYPKRNYRGVAEATVVAGPDMIPPTWGLGIITMLTRQ